MSQTRAEKGTLVYTRLWRGVQVRAPRPPGFIPYRLNIKLSVLNFRPTLVTRLRDPHFLTEQS